jgi:hypothetical protein
MYGKRPEKPPVSKIKPLKSTAKKPMTLRRTRRSREVEKLLPLQWLQDFPVRHFGFSSFEWMDFEQKQVVAIRAARLAARKCEYDDALHVLRKRAHKALLFCRKQDEALEWLQLRAQRAKLHCGRQEKTLAWLNNLGQKCKRNAKRLAEVRRRLFEPAVTRFAAMVYLTTAIVILFRHDFFSSG